MQQVKILFMLLTKPERKRVGVLIVMTPGDGVSGYAGCGVDVAIHGGTGQNRASANQFAQLREYSIGKHLVEGYLRQPYSWFLSRHSTELSKIILSEVNVFSDDVIQRFCKRTCSIR